MREYDEQSWLRLFIELGYMVGLQQGSSIKALGANRVYMRHANLWAGLFAFIFHSWIPALKYLERVKIWGQLNYMYVHEQTT